MRLQPAPVARRTLLVSLVAGAVLALAAWRAPFHLHLLRSTPEANATVPTPPQAIRLWFSQAPELQVTSVTVRGPGTSAIPLAPLAGGESALVVAAVKGTMPPGAYTVTWRTMARDGHVARGTFAFTIEPKR